MQIVWFPPNAMTMFILSPRTLDRKVRILTVMPEAPIVRNLILHRLASQQLCPFDNGDPMMKRLTKNCLTALLCSTALCSAATAQQLAPISESRIDLSDFAQANNLPINPLPGGSQDSVLEIASGPALSSSSDLSAPKVVDVPRQRSAVGKPPTSINGPTAAESVVDSGEVIYEDGYYEGEVYEGVVEEVYDTHTVIGFSTLNFRRNYGDDRLLSNNFTELGDTLSTSDADHGKIGGFETYLQCRAGNGVGWEFRYFGFDPSDNTATLGNDPTTVLVGLNDISEGPGEPTVSDIFAAGNFHSLTRDSSFYNVEFNFLQNRPDITWFNGFFKNTETSFGFRYIDFDESLSYRSSSDSGVVPRSVALDSAVENSLYGLQIGGRSEFCLYRKFSGFLGLKFGTFYTNAEANRRITGEFADGSAFNPSIQNGSTGTNGYDFGGDEDDVSFLGEVDLGVTYQLNHWSRLKFGYRRIGISGLAFASNNIPDDLADEEQLNDVTDSQSLRLRGIYLSYELAF